MHIHYVVLTLFLEYLRRITISRLQTCPVLLGVQRLYFEMCRSVLSVGVSFLLDVIMFVKKFVMVLECISNRFC